MSENTTIAIRRETKELLTKIGHKGQKYDDIVKDLLEIYNKNLNKEAKKKH